MSSQRTKTDFLCLTISAGEGREEYRSHGVNYRYTIGVQSDATGARIRFDYHDSIARHGSNIDHLDREGLLYALWAFVNDAQAGADNFRTFANEYGYNSDSIEAKRIWRACQAATRKFDRLFHDHREPSRRSPGSRPRGDRVTTRSLALAVALAMAALMATARPGADQPATSPDVMTYEGEKP